MVAPSQTRLQIKILPRCNTKSKKLGRAVKQSACIKKATTYFTSWYTKGCNWLARINNAIISYDNMRPLAQEHHPKPLSDPNPPLRAALHEYKKILEEANKYGILAEDMGLRPLPSDLTTQFLQEENAKISQYLKEDAADAKDLQINNLIDIFQNMNFGMSYGGVSGNKKSDHLGTARERDAMRHLKNPMQHVPWGQPAASNVSFADRPNPFEQPPGAPNTVGWPQQDPSSQSNWNNPQQKHGGGGDGGCPYR